MNERKLAWLSLQVTRTTGTSLSVDREMPTLTKPARAGQWRQEAAAFSDWCKRLSHSRPILKSIWLSEGPNPTRLFNTLWEQVLDLVGRMSLHPTSVWWCGLVTYLGASVFERVMSWECVTSRNRQQLFLSIWCADGSLVSPGGWLPSQRNLAWLNSRLSLWHPSVQLTS